MGGVLTAFLRGDLIVRSLYDDQIRLRQSADTQVERNTDAVVRLVSSLDKLAAVSQERDRVFEKALDGLSDDLRTTTGGPGGGR